MPGEVFSDRMRGHVEGATVTFWILFILYCLLHI